MIDFILKINQKQERFDLDSVFIESPRKIIQFENQNFKFLFWGDPILSENLISQLTETNELCIKTFIAQTPGHFYYLIFEKIKNQINIGNSIFGILPIYYSFLEGVILLSNNATSIANNLQNPTISKRFILENILFNYQLFNHTCFVEIKLLPTNNYIEISNNKFDIKEILRIENYFSKKPIPWRKKIEYISKLFLKRVQTYLPDINYVSALTGGFDGRTLVSCGLFYKKNFQTYSFGNENTTDVSIPKKISEKSHTKYIHISLDETYVKNESLINGLEFIINSNGNASFSRAHYLYAAKKLVQKTNYIISGNFGSELFRAAHVAGVVISPNLYTLLNSNSFEESVKSIFDSENWQALNRDEFKTEWAELVEDLKRLPCFDNKYASLTKNEQFYVIVFNEVFRKYFGAEMTNQYKLLINRTPFLDLNFIQELLMTELAGVHSDFFTHNPIKRFKGQVTYAQIIRKSYPEFGNILTDKGYKPNDLLSFFGKIKIVLSYIKKKIKNNKAENSDGYSVNKSFEYNRGAFKKIIKENNLYNFKYITEGLENKYKNKDSFFIALSQLYYTNYLKEKYVHKN